MQGMFFLGDKQVALRDVPAPSGPTGRQVVLKMRAAGLCGSDLRPYRSTLEGLGPRAGVIGGHEPCGEVVELGPEARNVRVGDRVMVHHYTGCGYCEHCLSGWAQLCPNGMTLYGSQAHGAMAPYQLVEDHMCVPMPDGLSFAEGAACSCGTGTAYQALRRLGVSGRDTFAVFGQGPVGLSATLFGAASGSYVIAVDPIPERRALAPQARRVRDHRPRTRSTPSRSSAPPRTAAAPTPPSTPPASPRCALRPSARRASGDAAASSARAAPSPSTPPTTSSTARSR